MGGGGLLGRSLLDRGLSFGSSLPSAPSSSSGGVSRAIFSLLSSDSSALILNEVLILSLFVLFPGKWDNILSKSEVLRDVLHSFGVEEVVKPLPVEDKFDVASVLEGSKEHSDVNVGNSSTLVRDSWVILVEYDYSFLQQVSIHCLFICLWNLDHALVVNI